MLLLVLLLLDFDVKFVLSMIIDRLLLDYCGPPLALPWDSCRVAVRLHDGVVVGVLRNCCRVFCCVCACLAV